MGIKDDMLDDLRRDLCPKPCEGPITRAWVRYSGGERILVKGEDPKPYCDVCPERSYDKPGERGAVRHVEVILDAHTAEAEGWTGRDDQNVVVWP